MMVINDMSLAMDAQRRWTEDPIEQRRIRERGAKIYFIHLQISHIYEAMAIIQEIQDTPALMKAVDRSDCFTRSSFDQLLKFIGSSEFQKVIGHIRNNLTFHCDSKTIERAMQSLVSKHPERDERCR